MRAGLLGMQHGGDAAEDHLDAPGPVGVGDFPAASDLDRQHHGNAHQVHRVVEIDGLQVFVDEVHFDVCGQAGGEDHRAVGGQVKLGLLMQLGPAGVDDAEFHRDRDLQRRMGNGDDKTAVKCISKTVCFGGRNLFSGAVECYGPPSCLSSPGRASTRSRSS